jgi:hypothetical protein
MAQDRNAASSAVASTFCSTRRKVDSCPYHLTHAERRKYEAAGVVGVLSDRERARPGQPRALPEQQHREHTMAYPTRFTRIENLGEGLHQRRHRRTGLGAASTAIASSRSTSICSRAATIGDTDNAGTGLSEVIKDFDTLMITSDPCPSWHLRPHVAAGQRPLIATLPEPWPDTGPNLVAGAEAGELGRGVLGSRGRCQRSPRPVRGRR